MGTTESRRGGALLAVLWLSAALATIAFSLASSIRGEVERAGANVDGTRAYYLATGAVERTLLHMMWARQNPNLPPPYRPVATAFDVAVFPGGEARVEIIPETARLNINTAPPELIFRLLEGLGVDPSRAQQITAAIVDWRGPAPAEGAGPFDELYLARNPSFRVRHASLEETEELLLLPGMTPDIYYGTWRRTEGGPLARQPGLADCVSIYGANERFDANYAEPALMSAIGVPPDTIAAVVARRREMPFLNDGELNAFVPGSGGRLKVGGNSIFTLRATARLRQPDGRLSDLRRTVAEQIKFMPPGYDAPYHILRWYDNAWERQQ